MASQNSRAKLAVAVVKDCSKSAPEDLPIPVPGEGLKAPPAGLKFNSEHKLLVGRRHLLFAFVKLRFRPNLLEFFRISKCLNGFKKTIFWF